MPVSLHLCCTITIFPPLARHCMEEDEADGFCSVKLALSSVSKGGRCMLDEKTIARISKVRAVRHLALSLIAA